MTSLYLDPISIEPNIDVSEDYPAATNVMENVEAYGTNKPIFVTTLSKSSVIIADRDDVDKNIRVLISQVLGIDPKTNIVPDVSTSLSQPDNNTENHRENPNMHTPTLSPEKSQDKERSEDIIDELGNKDKTLLINPLSLLILKN